MEVTVGRPATDWSHQEWMKDPTYARRFKEAGDKFTQKVEDTLHLVGVHGIERPILHKGKQVFIEGKPLFENRRSEMILMRIAEARMPERYKQRVEQVNIQDIDSEKLSPEILDKLAEHMIQKALAGRPPEMIEEARKRIEAGEEVTIEELERHQLERTNPQGPKA
jgi:hypothetical protein